MGNDSIIRSRVKDALIKASTTFSEDHREVLSRYISEERDSKACWVLKKILENAGVAEEKNLPLCDDTGIPHLLLEIGKKSVLTGEMIASIRKGVAEGLRELPGRPMAVKGNEIERIEQSAGLNEDPGALEPAPIRIKTVDDDVIRLHILMQGGGPEIRGKTYRVFHKHKISVVIDEIIEWAIEGAAQLGCTPCVPAIGIGRSHYEAASLMLDAMIYGSFKNQSDLEIEITERINRSNIGPLGLKGNTTALASFLRIGPQRASGVRIVCLRLGCCVEPRVTSIRI